MGEGTRRLSDRDLRDAQLDVDDPEHFPGVVFDKPDPDDPPTVIAEYHRTGTEPRVWCCECQSHRPRNGFIVENSTGNRYLIGSTCGPKYYGLSFAQAKRRFKDEKDRQRLVRRLDAIFAQRDALDQWRRDVLNSTDLRRLDDAQADFKRRAPDTFFRLASVANSGLPLSIEVRVRDYAAEARRPDGENQSPIYTFERQSLGALDGAMLLSERDEYRTAFIALWEALKRAAQAHRDTNSLTLTALRRTVSEFDAALGEAQAARRGVENATAFFSASNIDRLSRWSASQDQVDIAADNSGLMITEHRRQTVTLTPIKPIRLPAFDGL